MNQYLKTKWAGRNLVHYKETDSTNVRAKAFGADGVHGTLIYADSQTAGRGRRGRSWESEEADNIYMSLYLKPEFAPNQAPMLTLIMAYAVACALTNAYGIQSGIKWPNDLVLNKKKICGILTEMNLAGTDIEHVVIGVGINVGNKCFPEELQETATSLWLETGKEFNREEIIAEIMNVFETEYEKFCKVGDLSIIQEEYNQILVNCGQEVRVLDAKGHFTAKAVGINELGELLVEKEDGTMEQVFAGEVSVRGIYGYV